MTDKKNDMVVTVENPETHQREFVVNPNVGGSEPEPTAEAVVEEVQSAGDAVAKIPSKTLSASLFSLVGLDLPVVHARLKELQAEGKIPDFKIVPIGITLSEELPAGTVTVIKDHLNKVIDIVIV